MFGIVLAFKALMRVETIPIILGLLLFLIAAAMIADAIVADDHSLPAERRSRERPERSRVGQIVFGAGMMCVAAVLVGRDQWRFTTLAIAIAVVLVVVGVGLNLRYIRGSLFGPILGRSEKRRESDLTAPTRRGRRK
jgi:predicted tellurium resistance membrane protein TerC